MKGEYDPEKGISGLIEEIHFIWNRTSDLPACSIVTQPTTVQCAPKVYSNYGNPCSLKFLIHGIYKPVLDICVLNLLFHFPLQYWEKLISSGYSGSYFIERVPPPSVGFGLIYKL
jgi:hypothetical protein